MAKADTNQAAEPGLTITLHPKRKPSRFVPVSIRSSGPHRKQAFGLIGIAKLQRLAHFPFDQFDLSLARGKLERRGVERIDQSLLGTSNRQCRERKQCLRLELRRHEAIDFAKSRADPPGEAPEIEQDRDLHVRAAARVEGRARQRGRGDAGRRTWNALPVGLQAPHSGREALGATRSTQVSSERPGTLDCPLRTAGAR